MTGVLWGVCWTRSTPLLYLAHMFYLMRKEQKINSKEEVVKVLSPEEIPLKKIELKKLKH